VLRENAVRRFVRGFVAICAVGIALSVGAGVGDAAPRAAENLGDVLNPGEELKPGQNLQSQDGHWRLDQQDDGNLVLSQVSAGCPICPIWSTGTAGHSGQGAVTAMAGDGNLVVMTPGAALWASYTDGNPGASLTVQNDGDLVIRHGQTVLWTRHMLVARLNSGEILHQNESVVSHNRLFTLYQGIDGNLVLYKGTRPLWSTGTNGYNYGYSSMQTDGNLVVRESGAEFPFLTLWASHTDGHPGAFLAVQDDGNLVIYQGSAPLWASGTAGS
jgi:hypothetical protein